MDGTFFITDGADIFSVANIILRYLTYAAAIYNGNGDKQTHNKNWKNNK